VDESGHSGDAGAAEGGDSADSRERSRVNGWATQDSPWSNSGAVLDTDNEVPAWRRPTPFPRNQAYPPVERTYGQVQPAPLPPQSTQPASAPPVPAPAPPGFIDALPSPEIPPSGDEATSRWADTRPRYSDLLAHLTPPGAEQARPPAPRVEPSRAEAGRLETGPLETGRLENSRLDNSRFETGRLDAGRLDAGPGETTGAIGREAGLTSRAGRPTSLRSAEPTSPGLRDYDLPAPNSAPPFPYEGDIEEPPAPQQRTPVPLVRPAAPRADWNAPEPPATEEGKPARPSYDPSSFPRRISYESAPPPADPPGYTPPAAYAAFGNRPPAAGGASSRPSAGGGPADPGPRVLPQRVPAQPDVPKVPEPPLTEPTAETPALARIATHLRRGDVQPRERQEGFDVQAILAAVRGVDGVRDASLRSTPSGAHSLRLDLAEGADPAEVSRRVARLLQERMGLDAAMKGDGPLMPPMAAPVSPPPPAPVSPPAQARVAPPSPSVRGLESVPGLRSGAGFGAGLAAADGRSAPPA
jgi:hypothetical protein